MVDPTPVEAMVGPVSPSQRHELTRRWAATAAAAGLSAGVADVLLSELFERYEEPHRRYHGLAHVLMTLRTLDDTAASVALRNRTPVELAAWFHDAIYDPVAPGNEEASAALAVERLHPLSCADDVARMVLATAGHVPSADDEAALCDADLAVLGAPPEVYGAYVVAVRGEYAHVSDEAWRTGRAAVLRHLMERPVFSTAHMAPREAAARSNMSAELAALESAG